MQVLFFRQHFGQIAIGLSNVDEFVKISRNLFQTCRDGRSHNFMSVDSGGVNNPWVGGKYDFTIRIAIVGEGLWCDESERTKQHLYAEVENHDGQKFYLAYRAPSRVIGEGLPDPTHMGQAILKKLLESLEGKKPGPWTNWIHVTKPEVPRRFRSLLGKVISRVHGSLGQGKEFFQDPKSR